MTDVAEVAAVREHLAQGRSEDALALADRLLESTPDGEEVRAVYVGAYLAEGVKRASRAREMRRAEIRKLPPKDLDYEDPEEIRAAFDGSVACFDKVLAVEEGHVKATLLRAGVLHTMDRDRGRTVGILQGLLEAHPEARDVMMNLRKVMRPCVKCEDTGFCRTCLGRGERKGLFSSGRCEDCLGQGICRRCSVV